MKISNEVRIGILATVTIIASVLGYKFLKGQNLLSRSIDILAEFNEIDQLTISSPVFYRGFEVGSVADIYLNPEDSRKIIVKMNIKKPIGVPKTAMAELFATSVLGGRSIRLLYPTPCNGADCAENNAKIQSRTAGLVESLVGGADSFDPYIDKAKKGVSGIVDTLKNGMSDPNSELAKTFRDMQATVANLKATTESLNKLMAASSGNIQGILKNLESVSGNLQASNAQIRGILANAEAFSGNLKSMDLSKTTNGANEAMAELKKTLASSEKAVADLNVITTNLKNGQGSLGKLLSNDTLYTNLTTTLTGVNLLTQDLRLNPRRYVNLNPFKKGAKAYVFPKDDPIYKVTGDSLQRVNTGKKQ